MGKQLLSAKKNIFQNRLTAPKPIHPGAKVGTQTHKTMADFKQSIQNQVPAQVQPSMLCGPNAPKFDQALRKREVEKVMFAQQCGVTDAEYNSSGVPFVFDSAALEVIKFNGYSKWECIEHNMVFTSKRTRYAHFREYHRDSLFVSKKKNGQFKNKFSQKSLRAIKDRARKVFSDGEYKQLLEERVTYIEDVPLINRRCPSVHCDLTYPDHVTVSHFDMLKIQKIDDQINKLMGGQTIKDHGRDNDDDTSEMEMLNAQFGSLMFLEQAVEKYQESALSEGKCFAYSSDRESVSEIVLDGQHQITPISGAQFYQANGGQVFNTNLTPDWQPRSVSEINLPVGQEDSVSHMELGSAYYADVSDRRVSSNQSMLD